MGLSQISCCLIMVLFLFLFTGLSASTFISDGIFESPYSTNRRLLEAKKGLLTIGPRFGGAIDDAARYFKDAYDKGFTPYEFVESMKKKGIRISAIGHREDKLEKSMVADNDSGKSIESDVCTSSDIFLKKSWVSKKYYSNIFLFSTFHSVFTIFSDLNGYTLMWVTCDLHYIRNYL